MADNCTIGRELKSRGFIESVNKSWIKTDYLGNPTVEYKEAKLTAEVVGDKPPYHVTFSETGSYRKTNSEGEWLNWATYRNKAYILRFQLYENINGKIELSKELQQKVDDYNSRQTKDRKKIIEGRDYNK